MLPAARGSHSRSTTCSRRLFEWDTPVWEHDLEKGLRMLRLAVDTHLIQPLRVGAAPLAASRASTIDGSQPDCWRYFVEVQDAGRPADPTGYR